MGKKIFKNMKKIKKIIREIVEKLISEAIEHEDINISNLEDLNSKVFPVISDNEELKRGMKFSLENIKDYDKDDFTQQLIDKFLEDLNVFILKKKPNFFQQFDTGYSGNKFVGSKYSLTKDMDIKEIAKLVKKELDIEFSDWKFSVKIDRFSGGQSLRVSIIDMPYTPFSEVVDNAYKSNENPNETRFDSIYNKQYLKDSEKIKSTINQYNMDDSNSQVDYFHTNFYSSVNLDNSVKAKFYPDNEDVIRSKKWNDEYEERRKKKKEIADSKKGKYKKGEKILFTFDKQTQSIPNGEYEGVILSSPNGRSLFPSYEIKFFVNKFFDKDKNVVDSEKPRTYTTKVFDEKYIKSIE